MVNRPIHQLMTPSSVRRSSKKVSTEEEIELKRARGELSCAECRRLKLKCDKKVPCGSCVRRGCSGICPNGSLSTGQGTRLVLPDTEHLHRKIVDMGQRIRQLEDALSILQASASNDVHPLLAEDMLALKYGAEAPSALSEPIEDSQSVPIDAFGTLTITDGEESNYFGQSAGAETLFLAGAEIGKSETGTSPEDELPQASSEIAELVSSLPFGTCSLSITDKNQKIIDTLFERLPLYPRATTLCETYMENAAWGFRPICREELIDEILVPIYSLAKDRKAALPEKQVEPPCHILSVLYLVFAHGALTDLTLPPYNSEAEDYFHLGRLALSIHSIFDLPTTQTVQALCLIAYYHSNSGRQYTLDKTWSLVSLANKVAQGMGLHRDPARFNFSPKAVQRRRALFWEIFSADLFHSMALGRPPSVSLPYVDCEFPVEDTTKINDDGKVEMGFYRWKYSFTKDVFVPVLELTLAAVPPSYKTILELDRKVREKVLPPSLNMYRLSPVDDYTTPSSYIQGRLLSLFRTSTMLQIHRSFFARAMLDSPTNPLRSPFAPSYLAAYRCASVIIRTTVLNFQKYPDLFTRFWAVWNHLLSAAVIVGSISARSPSSTIAPAARMELDLAFDLFTKGAIYSPRARSGLAILNKLKAKIDQTQTRYFSSRDDVSPNSFTALLPEIGADDELAMLGGQTRLLVSKILSRQSRVNARTSSILKPVSPASTPATITDESHSPSESVPEVHPSLVEYLSTLPSTSAMAMMDTTNRTNMMDIARYDESSLDNFESTSPMEGVSLDFPYDMIAHPSCMYPIIPPESSQGMSSIPDMGFFDSQIENAEPVISGEADMRERWISLMRQSGIFGAS